MGHKVRLVAILGATVAAATCELDQLINVDISGGIITTSVDTFVVVLDSVDHDDEAYVVVRSPAVPPLDLAARQAEVGSADLMLLPLASMTAPVRRTKLGGPVATWTLEDVQIMVELLERHGVVVKSRFSPLVFVELPGDPDQLHKLLSELVRHPRLDWVAPNQFISVRFGHEQ